MDLLDRPDRPTAIFAGSDFQALGVMRAARELGLRIPEDLSVVGYDDLPVTEWIGPPLTTIHQPLQEMAATATRMVLALAARRGAVQPAHRPGHRAGDPREHRSPRPDGLRLTDGACSTSRSHQLERYRPDVPEPDDFDDFWARTLAEARTARRARRRRSRVDDRAARSSRPGT